MAAPHRQTLAATAGTIAAASDAAMVWICPDRLACALARFERHAGLTCDEFRGLYDSGRLSDRPWARAWRDLIEIAETPAH